MSLTGLRERALGQKRSVLDTSLEAWLETTAGPSSRKDPAFEIHYSQTREVDHLMAGLRKSIEKALQEVERCGTILERASSIEDTILASCQIWEFFRSKLSQRLDAGWKSFLRIADELAWQSFKPVRDVALGEIRLCKPPPLVYLNSGWSPFTVKRDREYHVETLPRAFIRDPDFKKALSRLPFPVIGVPWYQTVHLPDAVAICHEVGHAVEADFDLTAQIEAAITASVDGEARHAEWLRRGSELFADFYGCLSVGPAFAWALAGILLADADTVTAQFDPAYPSRHGRMLFNAAVLRRLGFGAEADTFLAAWTRIYPGARAAEDEGEIDCIAAHLIGADPEDQPLGIRVKGRALRSILGFSRDQQTAADAEVASLKAGGEAVSSDIRVLASAAVSAAVDPKSRAHGPLMTAMRRACVDERRNKEAALPKASEGPRADYLQTAGAAVAADLLGLPADSGA